MDATLCVLKREAEEFAAAHDEQTQTRVRTAKDAKKQGRTKEKGLEFVR
jgi:hypothetical protein